MKSIRSFFAGAILGICILFSTSAVAQPGYLVPEGGGQYVDKFMSEFLALNKVKDPKVLIVPQARKVPKASSITLASRAFKKGGVQHIEVLDLSDLAKARKAIEDSDIIWMTGGSQTVLRRALQEADLVNLLHKKHKEGALIGGMSAGASVQSNVMMASGKKNPETGEWNTKLSHGLGLWSGVIIDQHFTDRNRLERLEEAIRMRPDQLGIGIDENAGVAYNGGNTFRVIGGTTVTVVKALNPSAKKDKIKLEVTVLKSGDEYVMDAVPSADDAHIAEGKGFFEFSVPERLDGKKMRVFYYRPAGDVTEMPVLFVMHGMLRNPDVYRDNWVALADEHKVLVVVPEFSKEDFPGSWAYNYGNIVTSKGVEIDEKYWSYSLIDPIFETVVKLTGSKAKQYDLFGHSAGSQFAHRFFLFNKDTKANRVVASNAGSYMMLDRDIDFPWGLGNTPVNKEYLKAAFSKQLVVQLGENDNDPNHHQLPKGKVAMQQGAHRLERGQYFFKTAQEFAKKEGLPFNWSIRTVPGAGHENKKMAVDAAKFLYGK